MGEYQEVPTCYVFEWKKLKEKFWKRKILKKKKIEKKICKKNFWLTQRGGNASRQKKTGKNLENKIEKIFEKILIFFFASPPRHLVT